MSDMEVGKFIVVAFAILVVFILFRGVKMVLRLVFFVLVIAAIFILWTRFQGA